LSELAALLAATTFGLYLWQQNPSRKTHDGNEIVAELSSISSSSSSSSLPPLLSSLAFGFGSSSSLIVKTEAEPRRPMGAPSLASASRLQQPRNVMINRMRSVAGRGLNEKYKVDWNTVLGEGAYGSVHPARLALTGEKVRESVCVYAREIKREREITV
jgi:hypothetical protein